MNANLLNRSGLLLVVVALLVTVHVRPGGWRAGAGDPDAAEPCARQVLIAAARDRHLTGEATCSAGGA